MGVGEKTATTLAMVMHELITNSMKYGALSSSEGFLDISGVSVGDTVILIWAETGGKPISATPELTGFGSRLVQRSITGQLGGEVSYDWQETGLVVTIRVPADQLAH